MSPPSTTLLIPFLRGQNEHWLQQAIDSLPEGMPYLVALNDGEMAEALNAALSTIETEFTMVMGADDIADVHMHDFLESLIWDVDVTYPSMCSFNEEGTKTGLIYEAEPFCPNRLLDWNYVPGIFLARTEKLKAVGWRQMDCLEDWDLHIRMMRSGARYKAVPEALVFVRQRADGRNQRVRTKTKEEWQRQIVGERPPLLATFFHQLTFNTTYLRCMLPARYLPGKISREHEVLYDEENWAFPACEGAAVFQFPGDIHRALMADVVCHDLGIPVFVEVDDNYLTVHPQQKRQGWGVKKSEDRRASTVEGHRYIAERADGVVVSTKHLQRVYSKVNENVHVCRNSIDPGDWPEIVKPDDGVFRIGWYASWSHIGDDKLVAAALEWASRQPDVEVVTMGYDPSTWRFRRRHLPWSNDYGTYWKAMEILDVGLSPVGSSDWARARSDIKALEYLMAGACPVVSELEPHEELPEEVCFKAAGKKDFYKIIRHLVENRDEARAVAAQGKRYVLEQRTIHTEIDRWRKALMTKEKT